MRRSLLVVPLLALAACGGPGEVEPADLESQVSDQLDESGVEADSVDCPDPLPAEVDAQVRCDIAAGENDGVVLLTATEVDGDRVRFDIVEELEPDALAERVNELLTQEVGQSPDDITCPDPLLRRDGEETTCVLTAGSDELDVAVSIEGDGPDAQLNVEVEPATTP